MSKGYSLHIGLNSVNPSCYEGWSGVLKFAEEDALAMYKIARNQKFEYSQCLPTVMATRKRVFSEIRSLIKKAKSGDLVFISYSGHGSVIPDIKGETLDVSETWCCYDGMVIDKELLNLWSQFQAGVRILLVSDSCHSGDIARVEGGSDPISLALERGAKFFPIEKSLAVIKKQLAFYKKIVNKLIPIDDKQLLVRVKQIGGCAADKFSYEGNGNGELTLAIKTAYDNGAFQGNYGAFFNKILEKMATDLQTPILLNIGAEDQVFDSALPFSVEPDKIIMSIINPIITTVEAPQLLVDFGKNKDKATPAVKSADFQGSYSIADREIAVFSLKAKATQTAWDAAHNLYDELKTKGQPVHFVEPELNMETGIAEIHKQSENGGVFLETWPYPQDRAINYLWHLDKDFSQLALARDSIMNDPILKAEIEASPIRIAHIDTGFFNYKDFKPEKLNIGLSKSFVPGEEQNLAADFHINGIMPEQQGHGTATLALLAGPMVNSPKGLDGFTGYIGAIPFAEVISIRIQDSVALLKTRAFEQAVYYAVEQKCEVITMSMAGAPSRRWAEAVNYAYEKGVTIVSAAGNSWTETIKKYLPKYLLFPARFERVIGAAGVTYSQQPYVFEANNWGKRPKTAGGINMQGNYGPEEQMQHVMAAYTPNVIWADTGQEDDNGKKINPPQPKFIMTGGGTSSATPQIAAAAALWITKHRKELADKKYTGNWQQVEAVRAALFEKGYYAEKRFKTYIGRGALRAFDSLQVPPAQTLSLSEDAKTPFLPLIQTLFGLLKSKNVPDVVKMEMLALELSQLVVTEPAFEKYGHIDFQNKAVLANLSKIEHDELKLLIQESAGASSVLKEMFSAI